MIVYLAVGSEVSLQTNDTLLAEILGEHVTRTAANTLWVGHFVRFCLSESELKLVRGYSLKIIFVQKQKDRN